MKTSELTGAALDWAVHYAIHGTCEGYSPYEYSADWAQGGPIIEREKISVWARSTDFAAESFNEGQEGFVKEGPTPLMAAMRCYVASKMGDDVELPEGLTC